MEPFELNVASAEFANSKIYQAIKNCEPQSVLEAIYQRENVNLRDAEFQTSYLHLVASVAAESPRPTERRLIPIVYQLSNAGIDIDARDYRGQTALQTAIENKLCEIMVALLRVGADQTEKNYKKLIANHQNSTLDERQRMLGYFEKYEPGLWTAVACRNGAMVHLLVNSWCRVSLRRRRQPLLEFARSCGQADLVQILDDFEVTIELVHAALAGDRHRMLEFLMDSKPCDVHIMDISYQGDWSLPLAPRSLRDVTVEMGQAHVLDLLPARRIDDDGDFDIVGCDDVGRYVTSMTSSTTEEQKDLSSPWNKIDLSKLVSADNDTGDALDSNRSPKLTKPKDTAKEPRSQRTHHKGQLSATKQGSVETVQKTLETSGNHETLNSQRRTGSDPNTSTHREDLTKISSDVNKESGTDATVRPPPLKKSYSKKLRSSLCEIS